MAQAHHAAKLRGLAELEERYRHELMDPDAREEVRERIVRLRRLLTDAAS